MANYTTNLHLEKPEYNETADIEIINQNMEKIDSEMTYKTATGTGTEIKLSLPETFGNGYNTTFIASANNGAAATTINGKPLYKPNTTTPPNIISGKAYSIWYNAPGDCFFLKASAEGNAPQSSVLAGATFSNDNDTGLKGTMNDLRSNNVYCGAEGINTLKVYDGNTNFAQLKITPSPNHKPNGYVDHTTTFETHLLNLIPQHIKAGVSIAGKMTGTFTSDATAHAGHMLSGATAYVNSNKITGSIPYMNGTWGDQWETSEISRGQHSYNNGGMYAYMKVPANHYINGVNWIASYQPDLWEGNIVSGKNIFGVWGNATIQSMGGRRFSSGSAPMTAMQVSNNGSVAMPWTLIGFKPSIIFIQGGYWQTNYAYAFNTIALNINGFSISITAIVKGTDNNQAWKFVEGSGPMYNGAGDINVTLPYYRDLPGAQPKTFTWFAFE